MNERKNTFKLFKILLRIPVPWVFILIYLVGLALHFIFPFNILSEAGLFVIKIGGVVLFAIGAFFAAWSLLIFHKASTTTTPGEISKKLVTFGPYRLTRNPMYVSLILAYIGEAGFLTQIWPMIVLPFMLFYLNQVVIPLEEDLLKKEFDKEYDDYCTQVRRWI
jgi:protein-S-isoprenylcysteine O-methyltransferase Ste14